MATKTWNGTGDWSTPANWGGTDPAPGDDDTIASGTVNLSGADSAITANSLTVDSGAAFSDVGIGVTVSGTAGIATAGDFFLQSGASVHITTGGLSITGTGRVGLDAPFVGGTGGTSLTVGGTLSNSSSDGNALDIGNVNITTADTVTASGLSNTGAISIEGSATVQATLDITAAAGFGTAGTVTGSIFLQNDALLEFASGQLTTIAAGAHLTLNGTNARVADASNTASNSALTGLTSVAGDFFLESGASVSTSAGLSITGTGRVGLDAPFVGGTGGTSLTVGGTLSNSSSDGNALDIGNVNITTADTVTASGLSNTGAISIEGSATVQATLDITAAAGFGTAGTVTGSIFLQNDALLEFASGQLTTIAAGAHLSLSGTNARVADASNTASNSALTGLTSVAGDFFLESGASVSTSAGLSITGTGRVGLDAPFVGGTGGTSLTVGGTLSNSSSDINALDIGNVNITTADTVTASGLSNTGAISIEGSATVQATLDITAAAGFGTAGTVTGSIFLQNDALLEFASGQLTTIAAGAHLSLSGTNARVADASNTASNSALTGLTSVAGDFFLESGASVSTSAGLSITGTGRVGLDAPFVGGTGGTSLTVGGTLSNSSSDGNALDIGNVNITTADTVTASGLSNTGAISIEGSATVQATLDITAAAGFGTAGTVTGSIFLQNDALLEFASGQLTTIAAGAHLSLSGTNARVADASNTASNSALTGLTSVAGDFFLENGASVSTSAGLSITGTGRVGLDAPFIGGTGGTSLTIAGTLSNSSSDGNALDIGNVNITTADTVTASGLSNTGAISIEGSATVQATLDITAAAGFGTAGTVTGSIFLQNDALLEFASGQLTTIAAGAHLSLSGTNARVADASNTASNSALTGLTSVAGDFFLENGASVSTSAGLSITGTGRVGLDAPFIGGTGGTSLTIAGTLSNSSSDSNALDIGNVSITAADAVTASGLSNSGAINLEGGSAAHLGELVINGPATNNGTLDIDSFGEILMGAGDHYTQAGGATNVAANGVLDPTIVDVTGGSLDGTGTVDGTVNNNGGGTVFGGLTLGTPGTLTINGAYNQTGTGIFEANIDSGGITSGVVHVNGAFVNLSGGTLLVSNTPAIGDLLTVMTFGAGDLIGQFAHVQDGTSIGDGSHVNLGDGTTLEVFYNNDSGTIQIERVNNSTLAANYHWIDATGNWSTATDWSGGKVPDPTADVVIGDTTTGNVTLNGSSGDTTVNSVSILASNALTVSGVTLTAATGGSGISVAASGTLSLSGSGEIDGSVLSGAGLFQTVGAQTGVLAGDTISTGSTFTGANNSITYLEGTITNDGTIALDSTANITELRIPGGATTTLTGGGTVSLSNNINNLVRDANAATGKLINVNNLIEGAGNIGAGEMSLDNQALGVIDANQSAALILQPNGSGYTNEGLLEATGGGTLELDGQSFSQTGAGTITASGGGSIVELVNTTVTGGTLTTTGGGTLESLGNTTDALDNVTISASSTFTGANNSITYLEDTITNDGTIALDSTANTTELRIPAAATTTLTGSGTVSLSNSALNLIRDANAGTGKLINVNNLIEGAGNIGDGEMSLDNQASGIIDANQPTTLILQPNGSGYTNEGLLEATNAATLELLNGGFTQTGGTIEASGAGSAVVLDTATVVGGTLTTVTGGVIESLGNTTDTLSNLTISASSTFTGANNSITYLVGTITNDGTIALDSTANTTELRIPAGATTTLTGGGTVSLSNNANNLIRDANAATGKLINVNNLIEGAGNIGDGEMSLDNQAGGTIDADFSSNALILQPNGSGYTNEGLLEATNAATLELLNGGFTQTGGTIEASGAGSAVVLDTATVVGGTLTTVSGGVIESLGSTTDTLSNLTISTGSTFTGANNSITYLVGTITNDGTIALDSTNNITELRVHAGQTVTLTGGGTVSLSNNANNVIRDADASTGTLINVNNLIEGSGNIGNGQMSLDNQALGIIDANQPTTLILQPNGSGYTNEGLLEATNAATLELLNGGFTQTGGTIEASGAGSAVVLDTATVVGGTLTTVSGGVIESLGSTTDTLSNLTISTGSTFTGANNSITYLVGTITNDGTIALDSTNNITELRVHAGQTVTLTGGGTVSLSNNANNVIRDADASTGTLINVNNLIEGSGNIGNGQMVFDNQVGGTVDANQSAALILQPNAGIANGVTNEGTFEASNGGTLTLTGGKFTNTGMVEALDNSAVSYTSSATNTNNLTGTLTGGTWKAIANGHAAVLSITGAAVTTDAATIVLSGTGSVFQAGNGSTYTALENSLTTIASTGELDILNNRNYATTVGALADNGKIVLGGGTLSGGALTIGGTGSLFGFGTVTDPANNGTIEANGGILDVTTAISGNGGLVIDANATLELGAATAEGASFAGANGTLKLDHAQTQPYTGTIAANFVVGDQIDILNADLGGAFATGTSTTFHSGNNTTTLTVNLSTGGPLTFTFAGDRTATNFQASHTATDSFITIGTGETLTVTETLSAVNEHVAVTGQVATFTDSNSSDASSAFTASINWGDGTTTTGTVSGSNGAFTVSAGSPGHAYADELSPNPTMTVTVTRTADSNTAAGGGTVVVGENDSFVGTLASITPTQNQSFSGTVATFTDSDHVTPSSDLTATINWGDNTTSAGTVTGSAGSFAVAGTHTYATAGAETVTVTLSDDAPGTATANASGSVTVAPSAFTVTETLSAVNEHVAVTGQVATIADSNTGDTASNFTASINWGDGTTTTGTVSGSNGAFTVSAGSPGHAYADEMSPNPTMTVTVTRNTDSTVASNGGTVQVGENDSLVGTLASITPTQNQSFSGTVATFTDSDHVTPSSDLTATINWGDNTTSTGTVTGSAGSFAVAGTHTYATAGAETVTVTLSDDAPGTATANASGSVNVTSATPVLGNGGNTVFWTQGNSPTVVDGALTVNDPGSSTLSGASVTISGGFRSGDMLNFTNQNGITGNYNPNTGVLGLTGNATLAQYQAALESVTFNSTDASPSQAGADSQRTISWQANNGTLSSNTITSTIDVGQIYNLTKGVDTINAGIGNDIINATSGTLSAGDVINGGGGTNTLALLGAGTFNLQLPTTLTGIQTVTAQEGQAASGSIAAQNQIVTLRNGLNNLTLNVNPDPTINPSNPKAPTITIVGGQNNDVINLGLTTGNDVVTVGSAAETVLGGSGSDLIMVNSSTIGATINGGTGTGTLDATGGGTFVMGNNITNIATVLFSPAASAFDFTANGIANLEFQGTVAALNGDTLRNFATTDAIDLTNLPFINGTTTASFVPNGNNGTLTVKQGSTVEATIALFGQLAASSFVAKSDGNGGTLITDPPQQVAMYLGIGAPAPHYPQ